MSTTPSTTGFIFFAIGDPKATPRAKACRIGGFTRVYTPSTADDWKTIVRISAREKWNGVQFIGPIALTMRFSMKRPKGHYTRKGLFKATAPKWHTSKPDFDNLAKAIADALTNLGVWRDDSQIASCLIEKRYSDTDAVGCLVDVTPL